jgi:hypothetical protein
MTTPRYVFAINFLYYVSQVAGILQVPLRVFKSIHLQNHFLQCCIYFTFAITPTPPIRLFVDSPHFTFRLPRLLPSLWSSIKVSHIIDMTRNSSFAAPLGLPRMPARFRQLRPGDAIRGISKWMARKSRSRRFAADMICSGPRPDLYPVSRLTYSYFRRLARRGGVKRIQTTIYEHIRDVIKSRLREVAIDQSLTTRIIALTIKDSLQTHRDAETDWSTRRPATQSMSIILTYSLESVRGCTNPEARPSLPRTSFSL